MQINWNKQQAFTIILSIPVYHVHRKLINSKIGYHIHHLAATNQTTNINYSIYSTKAYKHRHPVTPLRYETVKHLIAWFHLANLKKSNPKNSWKPEKIFETEKKVKQIRPSYRYLPANDLSFERCTLSREILAKQRNFESVSCSLPARSSFRRKEESRLKFNSRLWTA